MDAADWLRAYADRLGVAPPTDEEMQTLLALAGVAAHASERIAAPVACWLTARAGTDPQAGLALAKALAEDSAAGGRATGEEGRDA